MVYIYSICVYIDMFFVLYTSVFHFWSFGHIVVLNPMRIIFWSSTCCALFLVVSRASRLCELDFYTRLPGWATASGRGEVRWVFSSDVKFTCFIGCSQWVWVKTKNPGYHRWLSLFLVWTIQLLGYPILTHTHDDWFVSELVLVWFVASSALWSAHFRCHLRGSVVSIGSLFPTVELHRSFAQHISLQTPVRLGEQTTLSWHLKQIMLIVTLKNQLQDLASWRVTDFDIFLKLKFRTS